MNLKQIAEAANVIETDIGLSTDAVLNKLTQELGEFNDAVQNYRGIYCRRGGKIELVEEELGDLIFNIVSVCHRIGIDPSNLPKYAENTLRKFRERAHLYKEYMLEVKRKNEKTL